MFTFSTFCILCLYNQLYCIQCHSHKTSQTVASTKRHCLQCQIELEPPLLTMSGYIVIAVLQLQQNQIYEVLILQLLGTTKSSFWGQQSQASGGNKIKFMKYLYSSFWGQQSQASGGNKVKLQISDLKTCYHNYHMHLQTLVC